MADALAIQAQIATDASWNRQPALLSGPKFELPAGLGRIEGKNLFHSFSTFNLKPGESANFSGPAGVGNVLTRVTGGAASSIDGAINCSIEGANFYFMNPAGVVFGPNASVNVSGSFAVTTADYIKLEDGQHFDAQTRIDEVLTVAAPSAFGFLEPRPDSSIAGVQIRGAGLSAKDHNSISIACGSLDLQPAGKEGGISSRAALECPAGSIRIVAVNSAGELPLNDFRVSSFSRLGEVNLTGGSDLTTAGFEGGGRIIVKGDRVSLLDGSYLDSTTYGDLPAGDIEIDARSLTLSLTDAGADRSQILANSLWSKGNAGQIKLKVDQLEMHQADIAASSIGAQNAGFISVSSLTQMGCNVLLDDESWIYCFAQKDFLGSSPGNAGAIEIQCRDLTIRNKSRVSVDLTSDSAASRSGSISIRASGTIHLSSQGTISTLDAYSAEPAFQDDRGGSIAVTATLLSLENKSTDIITTTRGNRNGGDIRLTAAELRVLDQAWIGADTFSTGGGGSVAVSAGRVTVSGLGVISSGTANFDDDARETGEGSAGNILVEAKEGSVVLNTGGRIECESLKAHAGDIIVQSHDLISLAGNSRISVQSLGADAGSVSLRAGRAVQVLSGAIFAEAMGNGGNIEIDAPTLGLDSRSLPLSLYPLRANAIEGNGGYIGLSVDFIYTFGRSLEQSLSYRSLNPLAQQGTLSIRQGIDFGANLIGLPDALLKGSEHLTDGCARENPHANTFLVRGQGGLALWPDAFQPSMDLRPIGDTDVSTPP